MISEIREKDGTTCYLRHFRDWLDFVAMAEKVQSGCDGQDFNGMSCASLSEDDSEWHGTNSLLEAIQIAHQGWPEGRKMIIELSGEISIKELLSHTSRFSCSTDVAGDEPDIDCFLQGIPENMITLQEHISSGYGKVLRFFLNRSASCNIDSSAIIRKGIALVSMIKTMMLLGYTVEVSLTMAARENGLNYEVFIPVLHAGDPINLDTLAFMFIHPAVLRRLFFAVTECESTDIRSRFGFEDEEGYGTPTQPLCAPEDVVLFDWEDGLLSDDSQIIPFVEEILARVGIKVSSA
ncbi:MAG: putative phage protein [uncultured bacterium]|nr:MAG: putative phage protein [uncultured bacterium]